LPWRVLWRICLDIARDPRTLAIGLLLAHRIAQVAWRIAESQALRELAAYVNHHVVHIPALPFLGQ